MNKRFTFFLFCCVLLASCDKDEQVNIDFGREFYPVNSGNWISYEVDSIKYSDIDYPNIIIDTVHFFIKEEIDSAYTDNENRQTYRIVRWKKDNEADDWEVSRVWSLTPLNERIEKVEDDLRFIKLVFPVKENETWLGNIFIQAVDEYEYLKTWEYQYKQLNQSLMLNGQSFDSTVTVKQLDQENLIEKFYSAEVYARNVGMIYKEQAFLYKQHDLGSTWDNPERGLRVIYQITDYHKE